MTDPLQSLLVQQTQDQIYQAGLTLATSLGLPVTSWQPGDPTRSLYHLESEILAAVEQVVVGYIQSGFLDYASVPLPDGTTNPWLSILALELFNVVVPTATYATTSVTLTNSGGGVYIINAGDLTFKDSATGNTYHNTTGGTLSGSGGTLSVSVTADVAGTVAGNASVGGIDTLVTTLLGVTCSNPAAATALDAQSPTTTVQQCRNKLGSLSPNGPAAAYSFVALNSALTGIQTVNRVRTYADSSTGNVTIYVAGPSGALGGSDVAAVQAAVQQWAAPLCITPTVISAANVVVPVTYTIWVYKSVGQTSAQIQTAIQTALQSLFSVRPIGGDIIPPATTGSLYTTLIESTIRGVFPLQTFRVLVTAPASDTALTNGQVPALGTITATVNIISDPQ